MRRLVTRAAALLLAVALSAAADAQSDTTAPSISITSPAPGTVVSGTLLISASASDDTGVAGVQFRYNGANFRPEPGPAAYSGSADTTQGANGDYTITAEARDAAGNRTVSAPVTITVANTPPASRPAKFIPTFLVYYGAGPAFTAADAARLAKFDLLDVDRFRYADIESGTWAAVKALNPAVQIYLYQMAAEAPSFLDAAPSVSLNGLGRHDVSRGHSMGSLNGNQPGLFLLDANGNRVYNAWYSDPASNRYWYLMDFGNPSYQAYWIEATRADLVNQLWVADGVHADNCLAVPTFASYSAPPAKYASDADWSSAMNGFASTISAGMHGYAQRVWCNRGETRSPAGAAAWLALDAAATPPDVVAEEGAFAVAWGQWSTQFFSEEEWKRQVDTLGAVRNSKVAVFSSTQLAPDGAGTDNFGRPVTYWQTLWYALGSFLLSRYDFLNNAYFNFYGSGAAHSVIWWADEFEQIDLGRAIAPYVVSSFGAANIYWREFERGYVMVNPTATDVASIALARPCRVLSHGNLAPSPGSAASEIALGAHSAVFLLKD